MIDLLDFSKPMPNVQRFERGHIIIQSGDSSATKMYIFLKGSASSYTDASQTTEKHFISYKTGDFCGEMSLFLGQTPTSKVVASEESLCLVIGRAEAEDFFVNQPDATFALIQEMCRRAQQPLPAATALGKAPAVKTPPPPVTAPVPASAPTPAQPPPSAAAKAPLPVAAATPGPAAGAKTEPCSLFPAGHGHYELPLNNSDTDFLFYKSNTCPVCGHAFKSLAVKSSKLFARQTDTDLRVHYDNIEPLYYDIVTCPQCWFSALTEIFKDGQGNKAQLDPLLKEYRGQLTLHLDENRDTTAVFAGYYLAIICAPKCFRGADAIIAKLWLKLSHLYSDCKSPEMAKAAMEKALKHYMDAYEKSTTSMKQNQQLFYIIGELSLRLNDLANARKFLFQAKTDRGGSPVLARLTDDRIEYLRSLTNT